MKYVLAVLAVISAQAQIPDLGGDGIWLPAHVADSGSKGPTFRSSPRPS